MAKLVIKGHNSRGKEVIETLRMLGGNTDTSTMLAGDLIRYGYYMNSDGIIDFKHRSSFDGIDTIYTLEEFLEKFPYKVGDKVNYVKYNNECPNVYTIQMMWWNGAAVEYLLELSGFSALTKDLQPYKEENVEEQKKDYDECFPTDYLEFENNDDTWADEVEINLGKDHEIQFRGDKTFIVKKKLQYPKTYKECCDALGLKTMDNDAQGYKADLIINFQELLIARDVYWKIAGEQMGLGKPWEPDWVDGKQQKFFITTFNSQIELNLCATHSYAIGRHNHILAFPTEEIRDAFHGNFKDLIERCKTFL